MKYALMSYGIPASLLPLDEAGHLIFQTFEKSLMNRRLLETQIKERVASSNYIECPSQYDILLGRGKPYQDFPGNVRLHQLVELQRAAYDKMNKAGKTAAVLAIVHDIQELGGRFLKRATDGNQSDDDQSASWIEVDFVQAHRKVSNCFQTRKRLK